MTDASQGGSPKRTGHRRELEHWHPILAADALRDRPRAVTWQDIDLALFRTPSGQIGALEDICPHRRMRLSAGHVRGETLVCPYHGFCYQADGTGRSPNTPRLRLAARAFEAVERHGAIWVRSKGAATGFPDVEDPSYPAVGVTIRTVSAPLELVVDNFCEVEHTPTTHDLFGYAGPPLTDVTTEVMRTDTTVRVFNRGPQKPLPRAIERLFGIQPGDHFIDDWTVHFSPVHIIYHQYWVDPVSGVRRPNALRVAVFFTPIDLDETLIVAFSGAQVQGPRRWLTVATRPLTRWLVARELGLDVRMLERLASPDTSLRGMRLGRFDAALGAHRSGIARIYRG
ncbi:MAG: phenylpropionate dioxygenase-like ring-hydroxylating dioxygenase large terminal subunit [Myxococcota bacterium]|jgi:phenylpropionate dioxygenase-like ring-hydroxylating dioxygenase large terminal subunit